MPPVPPQPKPKLKSPSHWWNYEDLLVILLLGALFFLPGLNRICLFDRDEPRFAVAAHEMLTSGDYLVPRFNGDLRPDKPPLLYWLITLSYRVVGYNELGARLPSALAGLGTLLVVYFAAGSRFGRLTGILAALMLAATTLFIVESRLATADATMIFFTTLALACAWRAWDAAASPSPGILPQPQSLADHADPLDLPRPGTLPGPVPLATALTFWVALAAGTLTKGVPLLFVFVPMLALSLATAPIWSSWRRLPVASRLYHLPQTLAHAIFRGNWGWWRSLRPALGFPLLLVLVGWWFLAAGLATHGKLIADMVGTHFLYRVVGPFLDTFGLHLAGPVAPTTAPAQDPMHAYRYPPGFYFALLWATFWPWTFLLIPMAYHTLRRLRGRTPLAIDPRPYQFLLAWVLPMWVALELSRGKLIHYVLPLYIPLVILCADTLVQAWHRLTDVLAARWFSAARWVWLVLWLTLAAAALAVPYYYLANPELFRFALPLAGALVAVGVASTLAWNRPAFPFVTILGFGMALLLADTMVLPEIPELRIPQRVMATAHKLQDRGFALAAADYTPASLVFYHGQHLPLYGSPLDVPTFQNPAIPTCLITSQSGLDTLKDHHIPYFFIEILPSFSSPKHPRPTIYVLTNTPP